MYKFKCKGLSLLEILVTLAILGILTALTYPSYMNYLTRARIAEGFGFADAARIPVELMMISGSNQNIDLLQINGGPVDLISGIDWVPGGNNQSVIGHMLVEMNLPRLGVQKAFALELRTTGDWHCTPASAYAPVNISVDEDLLPAICDQDSALPNSVSTNIQPVTVASCPIGSEQIQVQNPRTSSSVSVCLKACPSGETRNSANPFQCDSPVTLVTQSAQTSTAAVCGIGQDCTHQDPSCPAGQEYIASVTVNTKVNADPFASFNHYKTSSTTFQNQCVAKCEDNFVFDPANPTQCTIAPSPNVHTCRGPKFICERSHITTGPQCTPDAPFAANHVENLIDGSRYVTRSCVSLSEAFAATKYNQEHPECRNYNVHDLQDAHFRCTFPCYGSECNIETVPSSGVLQWSDLIVDPATGQSRAKTDTDLPDGFN